MNPETVISTTAGVVLGGIITVVVAWIAYKGAGDQLRQEAADLRVRAERLQQAVNVLGLAMERAGWARLTRDEEGNITNILIAVGRSMEMSWDVHAGGQVDAPPDAD